MPRSPLQDYYDKRNFAVTPEPRGEVHGGRSGHSFVIQKHSARRLHYDFRLELDGTLKSWAVPKGPSLDPKVRRMAVETEDHPLDYASFEGIIPEGEYGGGSVIVWDRGHWEPEEDPREGYRKGKLRFRLDGEKLHGGWLLVRTRYEGRKHNWLLIKEPDDQARPGADYDITRARPDSVLSGLPVERAAESGRVHRAARAPRSGIAMPAAARRAPMPPGLRPQLATLVEAPPAGKDWIYEVKYDGYRLLARLDDGEVRLLTRNGNDWTARLAHLVEALATVPVNNAWLDGEIVLPGADGAPDFQALQNAFESEHTRAIRYYLFDLPYFNGHDFTRVPLTERRAILEAILAEVSGDSLAFSETFEADPDRLLGMACEMKLEGVIGKRARSGYMQQRSGDWIKLKCTERQEFLICGYTDPKGARQGFGSLLLGYHDSKGALRYAGKVGTGFTDASLKRTAALLGGLKRKTSPFHHGPAPAIARTAHWVRPSLVAEVSFLAWTRGGHLRRPVFHGLRSDKRASEISREESRPAASVEGRRQELGRRAAPDSRGQILGVKLSHPARLIDSRSGATKQNLAEYYARVADLMLAHMHDRPVSLVRAPRGVGGQKFFQKHATRRQIPGLRILDRSLDPGHDPLVTFEDPRALVQAAQANVFEFHTWNAHTGNIECPDRIIFDLDPGEGVQWPEIRDAARLTRTMLDELALTSFLKTSGGKGLHVVVPIAPRHDWEQARGLSKAVVEHLARTLPSLFVARSGPRNRIGRIFADYLRNGRGATTVCAFSPRLRPGLPVSVPLAWEELDDLDGSAHWSIGDADALLARPDPWHDYAATQQDLDHAITLMGTGART